MPRLRFKSSSITEYWWEHKERIIGNSKNFLISVVGNDGTVYVLIKDTGFDSGSAMAEYFKLVRENADKKDRVQLAMKTILKNSGDYGLIYKKGRKKL